MAEPFWLTQARKYIGQREQAGAAHNPRILRWWTLMRAPFTDDETPWCSAFCSGVLEESGIRSSRSAMARSYLNWGVKLTSPAVGAIVVFERGPKSGHVAFVVGRDAKGTSIMCLGGNQSDMVKISPFPLWRVLGYRWPAGQTQPLHLGVSTLPLMAANGALSTNEA